jgi:hypothetical protein
MMFALSLSPFSRVLPDLYSPLSISALLSWAVHCSYQNASIRICAFVPWVKIVLSSVIQQMHSLVNLASTEHLLCVR